MKRFTLISKRNLGRLSKTPGVYTLKNNKEILYIGKAVDLKERVKNHFQNPSYRDNLFLDKISKIGFIETNSEIEALLLEASLIKKYQPRYNVIWRDDKNYFYVAIVRTDVPYIFITHQIKVQSSKLKTQNHNLKLKVDYLGPFIEGTSLKKTLRLLRKSFPYYTVKKHSSAPCLWCHLKLCPGPNPDSKQYKKDIKNLIGVLKGKKQKVLKNLKKEMKISSREKDFEKAARVRDQIFSLEKIMAHARVIEKTEEYDWEKTQEYLQKILKTKKEFSRIEGYDISNIQGQQATGSMVVFIDGLLNKSLYRKFKIKIAGKPNDTAMISEVIKRRLEHSEWPLPDLMLIDGGKPQLNTAIRIKNLESRIKNTKVIALAKKKNELFIEGRKKPILLKTLPREVFNLILQIRDEAHRFAIAYHHKLRRIDLMPKN